MFRLAFVLLLAGGAGTARGASQTWSVGSGDWDTSSLNWGGVAWTNGNAAVFGGTSNSTITLNAAITAASLTFNVTGDTLTNNSSYSLTLSGSGLSIGTGLTATISVPLVGSSGLSKTGAGKVIVTAPSTLSGNLAFSDGMLVLAGSNSVSMGTLTVNNNNLGANGWLEFAAGADYTFSSISVVGANNCTLPGIHVTGGSLTATGAYSIYNGGPTYKYSYVSGGTVTIGTQLSVGWGGGATTTASQWFIMSGGVVTVGTTADFWTSGSFSGLSEMIVSGGAFTSAGMMTFTPRNANQANLYIGGGTVTVNDAVSGVRLGTSSSASNGRVFLGGSGVLAVHKITKNSTTSASANYNTVFFHGGTLKALSDNAADFMGELGLPAAGNTALGNSSANAAFVYAGGAIFDTAGFDVTVNPDLIPRSPAANNGVGSVTIPGGSQGGGYSIAPNVTFNTPGGGAAAAGYLTLDGSGGIAAVVVTDPGSGYSSAATMSLSGGTLGPAGVAATPASWTADMISSTGGGLTKIGAGTLTLAGTNTYTGPTTVSNGTLNVSGAILGTGVVTVASGGTLGGTGTVAGATAVQAGGTLSAGDGGRGEMTFTGNLTIESGSTSAFDIAVADLSDRVNVAGTLTIAANAGVTLSAHENGRYSLFQYGTLSGSAMNLRVANANRSKAYKFRAEASTVVLDICEGGTLIVVQ